MAGKRSVDTRKRLAPLALPPQRRETEPAGRTSKHLAAVTQEDSRSDATKHVLKILVVHGANGEDPVDAALLLEGKEIMPGCGSTAKACTLLMGLIYALNLAYPPTLRYTFEVFQKPFLGLDGIKLTPKVQALKLNLLS
ncbi:hypothetical protein NQZ68_008874 [Dissostichus eleginoides]|nr:hypothetical protein NQZ68_008874 [Dissostichus eleginoides]